MKTILRTIIFLISIVSFSQEKLIGKYCLTFGEGDATCIDFKDNNRFEYEVSGCLGVSYLGSGVYELIDSNLKLTFDKKEQILKSGIVIKENATESEKETEFKFEIKDENGFEIPIYIMRLSDSKYFRIDEITQNIKIAKNSSIEIYRISFPGYEVIDLKLDSKTDKEIQINLFPVQPLLISDKELNWELTDFSDNGFSVGHNPYGYKYRKIEK
ncbi:MULTISPECIES: hypothetical protein [Bizionia]|uniref:Uncharacterized protein n=1 Tax=Bizionia algoritergicola TaxID=291187 RepID=A0A5D0QL83_9FLAO|nr:MULTISPECIES: hypothetical protein [Bizionia]OBX17893.1 hypothetical protein BAA08_15690 [Bizionia sp. APA-3]TYB69529.1 hypothetical protein ES675_16075 [Bizionia algoritergicola]